MLRTALGVKVLCVFPSVDRMINGEEFEGSATLPERSGKWSRGWQPSQFISPGTCRKARGRVLSERGENAKGAERKRGLESVFIN